MGAKKGTGTSVPMLIADHDTTLEKSPSLPITGKSVSIFGSTGSIGTSTLDLIERARAENGHDRDIYPIDVLTAHSRVDDLIEQAKKFRPNVAVITDEEHYSKLKEGLAGSGIEAASGRTALKESATRPVDWTMAGIVGAAGLEPTLNAVQQGAVVSLANKECLVCAGDLFMESVEANGATLLPVDSEHNAIYQVFDQANPQTVESLILTASGGPFRTWSRDQMAPVTPEQAVAHPNWDMGAKISVDSATMMNKGLELIEAAHLFPVAEEQIEIIVHPQSVVHSMVRYRDGSVLAQMGTPDMRIPIAYALAWPDRIETPAERLDFETVGELTFEKPDPARFPALRLARECLKTGGIAPTVMNAANEVAVRHFLNKNIGFLDILRVVESTVETMHSRWEETPLAEIDHIIEIDVQAREEAERVCVDVNQR